MLLPRRLLICGGRTFNDRPAILHRVRRLNPEIIIHGDAPGADTMAGSVARQLGIPLIVFPANWEGEGRAAGPNRNQRMIVEGRPDYVLAAPGGVGTADMIQRAESAGIRVERLAV